MGHTKHTTGTRVSTTGRRLGWRSCLRKECGRRYLARHWKQRYCREPDCLREVRRWQATKRQRKRRATAEGREKHAQAERERRKKTQATPSSSSTKGLGRGHAIKKCLPGRFAIGPAVSKPLELPFEPPRITAATSAGRPCVAYETANASGGVARRKRNARSVAATTDRPSRDACHLTAPPARKRATRIKLDRAMGNIRSASIGALTRRR